MTATKTAMSAQSVARIPNSPQRAAAVCCPFHDGAATLDLLLAELDPRDIALFDAALDLRTLAVAREDAGACVTQLLAVRRLLAGRHYLAFYRVRSWAKQALRIEVRSGRGEPWVSHGLALDCARIEEIVNSALATLATDGAMPAGAHARFAFDSE